MMPMEGPESGTIASDLLLGYVGIYISHLGGGARPRPLTLKLRHDGAC